VGEDKPAFLASSMREDVPTLAEFLGSLGYQTGGIVANFGVLSQFGVSRGFEDYVADPGPAYFAPRILWFYRLRIHEWSLGEFLRGLLPGSLQGHGKMFSVREPDTRRAHEINARTRQWLDQHGSRPFFLFLNYMDAHDPYLPIPEDDERFMQRPAGDEWFGFPMERLAESKRGAATFSATEIEFLQAQYDAELVSLDREVGRLLEYLKEAGLYENTLILVTTDHGEAFFERGFPDHGNSLYQPEVGGFLLIKTPSSMGPVEVSPMMQAVDFFPSVAAMLNEPIPADVQGRPWGAGRDYALSEVFCKSCGREVFEPGWPDAMRHDLVGMVSGGRKLIRSTRGPDEVYDLTADPGELHPMSEVDTEFLRLADAVIAERNKRLVETLSVNPDDKTLIEKLRSLGYIQ
jgi:arylsulfatase A-like enzyme